MHVVKQPLDRQLDILYRAFSLHDVGASFDCLANITRDLRAAGVLPDDRIGVCSAIRASRQPLAAGAFVVGSLNPALGANWL
nr:hypothetical protein [uncultured Rhodopila sp.]